MTAAPRSFPPPWTAEVTPNRFIVRDANCQALSYVYFESEPGDFYAGYQGSVAVMAKIRGKILRMYAQDAHTISQPDVLARWGYSEVINSHSENCYADVPNISEIRKKRESGVPCSELTEDERRTLAIACTNCRPVLTNFLAGITRFQLKPVSRQYVGALLVAPCVWHPESKGEFVRFAEWVGIPPLTDHPADARNVICRPVYEPPTDALVIGRHNAESVLVDGFHRAVRFGDALPLVRNVRF